MSAASKYDCTSLADRIVTGVEALAVYSLQRMSSARFGEEVAIGNLY